MTCAAVWADHVILQVEDFDGPWRRQTNISGFLGTGFCTSNANPNVADSVMSHTVSIATAGRHAVWVRAYTSGNSRRALQVEAGGTLLAKTHTGSERQWAWEKAGDVDLPMGEVRLVVHDADDGFESVDAIMLTDKDDFDPVAADLEAGRWSVYRGQPPAEANAVQFQIDACCRALAGRTDPASREEWETRRVQVKQDLAHALGLDPMPDKTPLNARVTGRAERDLYSIENVLFESRPQFYVTANLYIPKNVTFPAPGMVITAGHAMDTGKNSDIYQMAQLGFVRQGLVVLAFDPIGQGERKLPGFDHPLGYGSLLVGWTNEGYIVWDTLRALDYLASRPEVDPARIGLAGNSGGGESTFYTMPFDDRFQAGGSCSFVCSYDQWLRFGGNHCICNHLPGIVHLMEEFEIIGLDVPRAFLAGSGLKDTIFPIAGVRETMRRTKALYALYGAEDRVTAVEGDHPHGWHPPLREACYGWMDRWLQGRGDGNPVAEGEYQAEDPASPDVLVLDGGPMPEDAVTMVELNRREADRLRQAYAVPPDAIEAWNQRVPAWREALWQVFGGRPEATPVVRETDAFEWENIHVEMLALTVEPGMETTAFYLRPKTAAARCPAMVYLHDVDKNQVREDPLARALLDAGTAVLALDPRGLGEAVAHDNQLASDSVCLGRPIFAQRVWDVIQAARYLAARDDVDAARIGCYGRGPMGLLGVFAQALETPFDRVVADAPLASFRFFLEDAQPQPIWLGVPNLLKAADVAQALALAAPKPVLTVNPVSYGNAPLTGEASGQELAYAQAMYRLAGAPDAFRIVTGEPEAVAQEVRAFLGL